MDHHLKEPFLEMGGGDQFSLSYSSKNSSVRCASSTSLKRHARRHASTAAGSWIPFMEISLSRTYVRAFLGFFRQSPGVCKGGIAHAIGF